MSAAGQKEDEVMPEVVDDYVNLPFDGQDDKSAGMVHILRPPELYPTMTESAYR
ncbi:hypothetical protein [Paenibacillus agaridevorans]|nr:hypothetical protein [Paenibacillus agaridevorans]